MLEKSKKFKKYLIFNYFFFYSIEILDESLI
jgi:hypothetical protein